ncbi:MAG: DinB family protein [Saprospiraceae bacterium]|nr:DinB family protein [Saprospiraceae bacterium]
MSSTLLEFFERDLLKLREEIGLYVDESAIWEIRGSIANSAGTLCLHLTGNLKHFIGAVLGNTGYIRQRELEFSLRNVPREELLAGIDEARIDIKNVLQSFSEADFDTTYPQEKHGQTVSNRYMLLHLLTHLNYHLGQVNYHRRLTVDGRR